MLVRDKSFYKTFFTLTFTIAAQNILAFGVNLADNMMLGSYSETSIAAASLINQIQYLLQMLSVNGLGTGALALVSQYWGKGDVEPIRRIIALMMKFSALLGVVFGGAAFFFPNTIIGLMTNQPDVVAEGVRYLRLMGLTYITFPLQSSLVTSMRGVKNVSIGPIVSAISLVTNIVLNYMLIFGNLGAPELGIRGAAIATIIARVLELAITIVYVRFFDRKLKLRFLAFLKPDAYYLRDFLKAALPVIGSAASWGVGNIIHVVILGHLSATVIAANSIYLPVYQVITVYSFGATWASSVMIGNTVGMGRTDLLKPYTRTLQLLYVANGLATALVLFAIHDLILGFYALSAETYALAHSFLTVLCIHVPLSSYLFPVESGIILGGGNTRFAFKLDSVFMWLWDIPLALLSAFVFHLPPLVTFILLKSDQFVKWIPCLITVNRYRWVRNLTREADKSV